MKLIWIVNGAIGIYAALTLLAVIVESVNKGPRLSVVTMGIAALVLVGSLASSGSMRHALTAIGLVGLQAAAIWVGQANGEVHLSHHIVRLVAAASIALGYWRAGAA